jgi:ubiquinone/menaquinone biosynthesis C-methylase UbiE
MLEFAAHGMRSDRVSFQPADAQHLPFAEGSFDLVLCQFGVMFFPNTCFVPMATTCSSASTGSR